MPLAGHHVPGGVLLFLGLDVGGRGASPACVVSDDSDLHDAHAVAEISVDRRVY